MEQHAGALDVAEEPVAQASAFVRAFDEARDVGDDDFASVDARDAKVWGQRRERIVRDLRLCGRYRGEERGLARIWQANDAGVRNQLQAQPEPALFARQAGVGAARGAVGGRLEMRIAEAAVAAARERPPCPCPCRAGRPWP
jgi:hypothetical protein